MVVWERSLIAAIAIAAPILAISLNTTEANAGAACEKSGEPSTKPLALEGPYQGLLTLYRDPRRGRLYLKVPPSSASGTNLGSFLFLSSLRSGLGSHRFRFTRGRFRQGGVVSIRRVGDRLIIERENSRYVAAGDDPAAQRAVKESFPTSIYWIGCVATRRTQDKSEVVDITDFLLRDFGGVAREFKRRKEGDFRLNTKLSFVDPASLHVFPDNVEIDGTLSFASKAPGRQVRQTMASPESLTLVQHISIVRRPPQGYSSRDFDPRAGLFHSRQFQFGRGNEKPLDHRYIIRHRLQKTDPGAAQSPARKPIVFYVDRSMPKPFRDAVLEGARWWKPAFDKIGFKDGFQVKLLPVGADPMDARYNVLQLVHRTKTAFSDGLSVRDSRTGEIVRSIVSLDSQRLRRHRRLYEGLVGAEKTGSGLINDPLRAGLARIRWLAAHEVGHALGFRHNFAASSFGNGRESVMDYSVPRIKIMPQGTLDLSNAYLGGIGAWDYFLVKYAYTQFPEGTDEKAALEIMVQQAQRDELLFLSDGDASRRGGVHPQAARYDYGPDPLADLKHRLRVRAIAFRNFGPGNLPADQPLALLRERFMPVYFFHNRQARNVAILIGGMTYRHSLSGSPQVVAMVEPARQHAAIDALTALVDPAFLDVPERILSFFPPRTIGYWREPGSRRDPTGRAFDALGIAERAAGGIFSALLAPARVSRLVDLNRRNEAIPSLERVLDALTKTAFRDAKEGGRYAEIRRTIQQNLVDKMLSLSLNKDVSKPARTRIEIHLANLRDRLTGVARQPDLAGRHAKWLADRIRRQLERPFGSDKVMASKNSRGGRPRADESDESVEGADDRPPVSFSDAAIYWRD